MFQELVVKLAVAASLLLIPTVAHAWPNSVSTCTSFARQDQSAEVVPANQTPNHTDVAAGVTFSDAQSWANQVGSGHFTGTTQQIIRYTACRWLGTSDTAVNRWKAQLSQESDWKQSAIGCDGDCFGIAQIRKSTWPSAFPRAQNSTAFNAEAGAMFMRACVAGKFSDWDNMGNYLSTSGSERYWFCVGVYYAGEQPTEANGGKQYIRDVKYRLANKIWPK